MRKRKRSFLASGSAVQFDNFQRFTWNSSPHLQNSPSTGPRTLANHKGEKGFYSYLISALISSLSFSLTTRHRHMPLGPGVFVQGDFTELDNFDAVAANHSEPNFGSISYLAACWQSDGSLLILSHSSAIAVSPLLAASPNPAVILAPFGWKGDLQRAPSPPPVRSRDSEHDSDAGLTSGWRKSCLLLLKLCGIVLSDDLDWVTVLLPRRFDEVPSTPIHIEWPSQLCFQFSEHSETPDFDLIQDHVSFKNLIDPLAAAEEWMLNFDALEQQVKARNHETPLDDLSNVDSSDEEQVPAGLQTVFSDSIEVQNVAGIYPTPPDGDKSHAKSVATPRTESALIPSVGTPAGGAESTDRFQASEVDYDTVSNTDINLGNYDHLEDDDLFGDMQTNLYADNGITEDDLSFFDRPEADKVSLENHQRIPTQPATKPRFQFQDPMSNKSNHSGEYKESLEPLQINQLPSPDSQKSIEHEGRQEMTSKISKTHNPPKALYYPTVEVGRHDKNGPRWVENKSKGRDWKYATKGKFAPSTGKQPISSNPHLNPKMNKGVPKIHGSGQLHQDPRKQAESSTVALNILTQQERRKSLGTTADRSNLPAEAFYVTSAPLSPQNASPLKALFQLSEALDENTSEHELKRRSHRRTQSKALGVDIVQLAQIVADQCIYYGTLTQNQTSQAILSKPPTKVSDRLLQEVIFSCLPQVRRCTLTELATLKVHTGAVEDEGQISGRTQLGRNEGTKGGLNFASRAAKSPDLLKLPDVLVKRGDSYMELSATALGFWKELGLCPVNSTKDVLGFCLCPDHGVVCRGALTLLEAVGQTYLSLRLGTHTMGHTVLKDYPSGIATFPIGESNVAALQGISNMCEAFGKETHLAQHNANVQRKITICTSRTQ